MKGKVDFIAVKTQNGEYAGWAEMYKGVLVKDQETGEDYVYAIERCNPQNRYFKIALSDLMVGETNDTLYINVEKENWGDTLKGEKKFNDDRIQCYVGTEGLTNDSSVLELLGMVATNKMTK